jgi:hypothetical protein
VETEGLVGQARHMLGDDLPTCETVTFPAETVYAYHFDLKPCLLFFKVNNGQFEDAGLGTAGGNAWRRGRSAHLSCQQTQQ